MRNFGSGKLNALVPRIAFSFRPRVENREKSATCRRIAIRCRSRVRPPLDIPRPAKSREKRLRPSEERAGGREGWRWRLRARDEVEDGIGIANIPLLRLSGLASLTDLSLRFSIDRSL